MGLERAATVVWEMARCGVVWRGMGGVRCGRGTYIDRKIESGEGGVGGRRHLDPVLWGLLGRAILARICRRLLPRLLGQRVVGTSLATIGELLDYLCGSCCAREPQGTTRDGVCVRTGTAGSSLLLTLVWIVFTEVSSSRSVSGLAAGIWCLQWYQLLVEG